MAFQIKDKYWKIVDIKVDRQIDKATVTLVGFKDKEDADKPKLAQFIPGYQKRMVVLEKENFPFINSAKPNQVALTYQKIQETDKFFKDAVNV